ncbi:MAG: endonuclease V [Candidatus Nitrosocaldus sp.]
MIGTSKTIFTQEHFEAIKRYQSRMANNVVAYDVIDARSIRYVVGVDVAYKGDTAFAVAVMVDRLDGSIVCEHGSISKVYIPYMPGLLFLREGAPMLRALMGLIKSIGRVDECIILVDGNGMLHPRLFGLACYIGIIIDKPTIGVSKSLLCGTIHHRNGHTAVMLEGKEVARVIGYNNKQFYISIGHKIGLDSAESIVRSLIYCRVREPLSSTSLLAEPEPLRLAHNAANSLRRSQTLP